MLKQHKCADVLPLYLNSNSYRICGKLLGDNTFIRVLQLMTPMRPEWVGYVL